MSQVLKYVSKTGEFIRRDSVFRNFITADGSSGFKAEADRYHLYVSYACPWAHRTLVVRKLKGLEDVITVNVVDWFLGEGGWRFTDEFPGNTLDTVNNCKFIREVYHKVMSDYPGPFTVPVLWDKVQTTIVNNESSEIIRMLNTEFNAFCKTEEQRKLDLYPEHLREQIDALNAWIYPNINNGVYRSGLNGDIHVFIFSLTCNKKMIKEYPNIWGYTRDLYQMNAFSETTNKDHIRKHYHESHKSINPYGILPIGPDLDFMEPHGREKLGQ